MAILTAQAAWAAPGEGARRLPDAVRPETRRALERLEAMGWRVRARFDPDRGTARTLRGDLGQLGTRPDGPALEAWVAAHAALLGLEASAAVQLDEVVTDRHGHTHARFVRTHRGVPVWGSDFTIHADPGGHVTAVTGRFEGALALTTRAQVGEAEARERARRHPRSRAASPRAEPAQLGVVSTDRGPRLAWRVEVTGAPEEAWAVWVDAETAEVVAEAPLVLDAVKPANASGVTGDGGTVVLDAAWSDAHGGYVLASWPPALGGRKHETLDAGGHEAFDPVATFATPVVSPTGVFSDTAAVDAHRHVRRVLDWLFEEHGWRGWDGRGAAMTTVVHFGRALNNAYWHGKLGAMLFGDGDGEVMTSLSGCLDISAHELTHAMVQATVRLAYAGQAGALNEHLADAFATFLDPPTGAPDDWHLGEDCLGPRAGWTFLRHIKEPWRAGQPGHLYEYVVMPETQEGDWGGVHINSGIPNRAMALMVEALGTEAVGQLYVQLLIGRYLPSRADFSDFRDGLLAACDALWGDASLTCNRVLAALDRVGLVAPGDAPPCPAGATEDALRGCRCPRGTRLDEAAWACGPLEAETCGGVPAMGTCAGDAPEGTAVLACVGGEVVRTACADATEACLYDPARRVHLCAPRPPACAAGRCAGDVPRAGGDGCAGGGGGASLLAAASALAWAGRRRLRAWARSRS